MPKISFLPAFGRLRAALAALLLLPLLLTACGGGGGGSSADTAEGTVYLGFTDADGDFLRYEVDIISLRLVRADGTEVDTLPRSSRLDFAQYRDLTEFFTAARVPAGRYVRGEITLDYSAADIQVEVGGAAEPAVARDGAGVPLGRYTLDVRLENDRPLVIAPGLPALLRVDFDLAASHEVDLTQEPPVVTAAPFLVAELEPVEDKDLRARGPLLGVDTTASTYRIDLRPFQRRDGRFGELTVHTAEATRFEIDGTSYTGSAGLAALAALPTGTLTVAFGTLVPEERKYHAHVVLAGDSVPGTRFDVVMGNVTHREGDTLTVRGALITPRTGNGRFHDDVRVLIGPETRVRSGAEAGTELDIGALSVGQRVEVFGTLAAGPAPGSTEPPLLDADPGRVRLLVTRLAGETLGVIPGQLRLDLRSIDGRRIGLFDFTGTGIAPEVDADPADYEIDTGALDLAHLEPGEGAQALGYVRPFGSAPDDFSAVTVIDRRAPFSAVLGLGWGARGTAAPFTSLGPDGLLPDLANPDIGVRHHLLTAAGLTDLLDLPAAPWIRPLGTGPGRYALAKGRRVEVFGEFAPFAARLAEEIGAGERVRSLHAEGRYDRDAHEIEARTVAVNLDRGAD
jgi:hypothetical protein